MLKQTIKTSTEIESKNPLFHTTLPWSNRPAASQALTTLLRQATIRKTRLEGYQLYNKQNVFVMSR